MSIWAGAAPRGGGGRQALTPRRADRSEIAFNKLTGEPNNYTAVKVLEGGFDAYVEAGLMTEKDLDPYRGREDGQTVFGQRSASGMWTGW